MSSRVTIAVALLAIGLAGYAAWQAVSHDPEPSYDRAAAERDGKAQGPKIKLPRLPPKKAEPPPEPSATKRPERPLRPQVKSPSEPDKSAAQLAEEAEKAAAALQQFEAAIAELKTFEDLADRAAEPWFRQARDSLHELDRNTNFSDDQSRRTLLTATETLSRYERRLSEALRE